VRTDAKSARCVMTDRSNRGSMKHCPSWRSWRIASEVYGCRFVLTEATEESSPLASLKSINAQSAGCSGARTMARSV
jgi:hypothetical protein